MKKIDLLAIFFVSLCSTQSPICAEEQAMADHTNVASNHQFNEAAKQHRYVKTQAFVNLLQKVQNSPEDAAKFIAYSLDWMQELSQSEDPADQELCRQLYTLISGIVQAMQEAESQEGAATQANQEQLTN